MKDIGLIIAANIVSIALVILAGYMMYIHQKGSGWVIMCAMICGLKDIRFHTSDEKKKIEN